MESPSEDINSALELFREKWRAEVRAKQPSNQQNQQNQVHNQVNSRSSFTGRPTPKPTPTPVQTRLQQPARILPPPFSPTIPAVSAPGPASRPASGPAPRPAFGSGPKADPSLLGEDGQGGGDDLAEATTLSADVIMAREDRDAEATKSRPFSALEYYEQAVEKEVQGSLGDSLRLYRTAFRMDNKVDQVYKAKHFPSAPQGHGRSQVHKPGQGSLLAAPAEQSDGPGSPSRPHPNSHHPLPHPRSQTKVDIANGFAGLSIQPTPPEVEGMPPAPCPIAYLPGEVLLHILLDVALDDVGDFVRLAQVCKRLAFLVVTEEQIWRHACLDSPFGFNGMPYHWKTGVTWGDLDDETERVDKAETSASTETLLHASYVSSWRHMFRHRPRIRFNGIYISTVNYVRQGQATATLVTWNSPVHICTYFRYLRFFRDGTCISLLTTASPADVVAYMTKELLELHRDGTMAHLPSAVMQNGLRGRWRLGSARPANPSASGEGDDSRGPANAPPAAEGHDAEGDLFVETEGVSKYMYRLDLALRSTGKTTRNNKLVWKSFWSYNLLTDDWAEFGLKNDKPFVFSRVRRYT